LRFRVMLSGKLGKYAKEVVLSGGRRYKAQRGNCRSIFSMTMPDPNAAPGPSGVDPKLYDLFATKREVDPQFAHQNQMLRWILLTVIGAAVSGGLALWQLTGGLQTQLAVLTTKVDAFDARIKDLPGSIKAVSDKLDAVHAETKTALQRIESKLPGEGPYAAVELGREEMQFIRDILGIKGPARKEPGISIGEVASGADLKPLPDTITDKVARLKGSKYYILNGHAIITGAGNRVIAIVSPASPA
jgi:hypothetical protein